MRLSISFALFLVPAVCISFGQAPKVAADPSAVAKSVRTDPSQSTSSQSNARQSPGAPRLNSSSSWEYWTNQTIPAGGSINFDSGLDYSASDSVRITVLSQNGADLSDLVTSAFWAVPPLQFFNAAEVVTNESSNGFYYSDARFASFKVYGSQFRLRLTNRGAFPIALAQVLIYTRVI